MSSDAYLARLAAAAFPKWPKVRAIHGELAFRVACVHVSHIAMNWPRALAARQLEEFLDLCAHIWEVVRLRPHAGAPTSLQDLVSKLAEVAAQEWCSREGATGVDLARAIAHGDWPHEAVLDRLGMDRASTLILASLVMERLAARLVGEADGRSSGRPSAATA